LSQDTRVGGENGGVPKKTGGQREGPGQIDKGGEAKQQKKYKKGGNTKRLDTKKG